MVPPSTRSIPIIRPIRSAASTPFEGAEATHAFDYVLSPTAPMTAFPAEWASPSRDPLNPFPHIGFTVAFNMSEQPAASVNCGFDPKGLPIGLQIVGRRFDDVGVLEVVRAYEMIRSAEMLPWPEPPKG